MSTVLIPMLIAGSPLAVLSLDGIRGAAVILLSILFCFQLSKTVDISVTLASLFKPVMSRVSAWKYLICGQNIIQNGFDKVCRLPMILLYRSTLSSKNFYAMSCIQTNMILPATLGKWQAFRNICTRQPLCLRFRS